MRRLADGPLALGDGLEPELPEQVLLEGLGRGDRAFEEHALGIVVGVGAAKPGSELFSKSRRRPSPTSRSSGRRLEGDGGPVLDDLEGGIRLDLLLDLLLELLKRHGHELDRLDHLGTEFLALFRDERGLLKLQPLPPVCGNSAESGPQMSYLQWYSIDT